MGIRRLFKDELYYDHHNHHYNNNNNKYYYYYYYILLGTVFPLSAVLLQHSVTITYNTEFHLDGPNSQETQQPNPLYSPNDGLL